MGAKTLHTAKVETPITHGNQNARLAVDHEMPSRGFLNWLPQEMDL